MPDMRTKAAREAARPVAMKDVHELMPKIYFVEDFGMGRYRVGRTDWPGDTFDLVSIADFKTFRKVYEGLNMPLINLTHED